MGKFCGQCGTPLPEGVSACPNCGAAVHSAPKKKRNKWWLIVIPAVLVLAIAAALLWTPVFIRVAPSAALAKAAAKTAEDLSERYDGSPWKMMRDAFEPEGQNRYSLRMDYLDDYSSVSLDMGLSTDSQTRQAALDFLMNEDGAELDARIYVDPECAVISSETLMAGTNFGITYETFSRDIRSNSLFYGMDEETISMLEQLVESAQTGMQRTERQEDWAKPYQDLAVSFLAQLEPVVGKEPLMLDDTQRGCYTITYTATGEMLADFLEQYISLIESDESIKVFQDLEQQQEILAEMRALTQDVPEEISECSAVFYIYHNYLVNFRSVVTGPNGEEIAADLFFGTDASVNDLRLSVVSKALGSSGGIDLTLSTAKLETGFREVLKVQKAGRSTSSGYEWDSNSGRLIFRITGDDLATYTIHCNLVELDDGFALSLDNLFEIISSVPDGGSAYWDGSEMPMTLTVQKGSAIEKPKFKNLDAWTEDDILAVLEQFY